MQHNLSLHACLCRTTLIAPFIMASNKMELTNSKLSASFSKTLLDKSKSKNSFSPICHLDSLSPLIFRGVKRCCLASQAMLGQRAVLPLQTLLKKSGIVRTVLEIGVSPGGGYGGRMGQSFCVGYKGR